MDQIDLRPAAREMARLVAGVSEAQLDDPTPCEGTSLGDLLDHVRGLTLAFTSAATKADNGAGDQPPSADASQLEPDWRSRIPDQLDRLAEAWRDSAAWSGTTRAGGLEMPGEIAGLVTLDELVIHGWDVARASGQRFECDEASLDAVHRFVAGFAEPGQEAQRAGLFGPVVAVPADAPRLDRVIGLTGRHPGWPAG